MSDYLRDSFIPYHTVGEQELVGINDELKAILEEVASNPDVNNPLSLFYTLRYDGMGIIRQDYKEIKNCFDRAKNVERLLFEVGGPQWRLQNKGKRIFLQFDSKDINRCYLSVGDDDEKWVDNVYKRLASRVEKCKNSNEIVRHPLVELFIQLCGVVGVFSFCLIFACYFSPKLKLKDSFFIIFIGLLLIFSNFWTYLLASLKKSRDDFWPIVSFKKKPFGWMGQTIVGCIITGILTLLAQQAWNILVEASSVVAR